MFTKSERLKGVMANSGIWGPLKYVTKYGDTLIEAIIPAPVLKKGLIPRSIMALIFHPTAENRMKLRLKGIKVKYTYAEKAYAQEENLAAA